MRTYVRSTTLYWDIIQERRNIYIMIMYRRYLYISKFYSNTLSRGKELKKRKTAFCFLQLISFGVTKKKSSIRFFEFFLKCQQWFQLVLYRDICHSDTPKDTRSTVWLNKMWQSEHHSIKTCFETSFVEITESQSAHTPTFMTSSIAQSLLDESPRR